MAKSENRENRVQVLKDFRSITHVCFLSEGKPHKVFPTFDNEICKKFNFRAGFLRAHHNRAKKSCRMG